jgi:D-inositol-3-phosphate glycosyltransferase
MVLFAGRIQPLKAPDVLVRALGVLAGRGRPRPLLVILGGASGRMTAVRELEALAAVIGVGADTVVRPPVGRAELADWYAAADLVAMPSRSESFGLVAAEAQACGTPVLASAVGGLRTIVQDGVTGRLVPSHEPEDWADALTALLADEPGLRRLGAAAARAGAGLGWDAAAASILKVYALADQRRRA